MIFDFVSTPIEITPSSGEFRSFASFVCGNSGWHIVRQHVFDGVREHEVVLVKGLDNALAVSDPNYRDKLAHQIKNGVYEKLIRIYENKQGFHTPRGQNGEYINLYALDKSEYGIGNLYKYLFYKDAHGASPEFVLNEITTLWLDGQYVSVNLPLDDEVCLAQSNLLHDCDANYMGRTVIMAGVSAAQQVPGQLIRKGIGTGKGCAGGLFLYDPDIVDNAQKRFLGYAGQYKVWVSWLDAVREFHLANVEAFARELFPADFASVKAILSSALPPIFIETIDDINEKYGLRESFRKEFPNGIIIGPIDAGDGMVAVQVLKTKQSGLFPDWETSIKKSIFGGVDPFLFMVSHRIFTPLLVKNLFALMDGDFIHIPQSFDTVSHLGGLVANTIERILSDRKVGKVEILDTQMPSAKLPRLARVWSNAIARMFMKLSLALIHGRVLIPLLKSRERVEKIGLHYIGYAGTFSQSEIFSGKPLAAFAIPNSEDDYAVEIKERARRLVAERYWSEYGDGSNDGSKQNFIEQFSQGYQNVLVACNGSEENVLATISFSLFTGGKYPDLAFLRPEVKYSFMARLGLDETTTGIAVGRFAKRKGVRFNASVFYEYILEKIGDLPVFLFAHQSVTNKVILLFRNKYPDYEIQSVIVSDKDLISVRRKKLNYPANSPEWYICNLPGYFRKNKDGNLVFLRINRREK